MWSILEEVPYAFEKNEYSVVLGWNVLYISVRSIWSSASFKALVSLLICCLGDLSIAESGLLRSPTINVLYLYVSILVKSWVVYFAAPLLGA